MNICLVSHEFPPETGWGGIGTYSFELSRALAQAGHRVWVVTCTNGKEELFVDSGVETHKLRVWRSWDHLRVLWRLPAVWPSFAWRAACRVERLHRAVGLDIVEAAEYGADSLFVKMLPRRPRLVVRLHSPSVMLNRFTGVIPTWQHRVAYMKEKLAIAGADALSAPARAIVDEACSWLPIIRRKHLCVVPNGITVSGWDGGLGRAEPPEVLYVGRLERRKGIDLVERIIPTVLNEFPNVTFRFVGADSLDEHQVSWRTRLTRAVPEYARSRLAFDHVPREHLPSLYQRATLSIIPSPWENFPYVALEAMAAGCPVIATNVGALPEIVTHGRNGLLVPPGDHEEFSRAIATLLRSPRQLDSMRVEARRRIREKFSWERVLPLMVGFYRAICDEAS
jgi:hypothetical protein